MESRDVELGTKAFAGCWGTCQQDPAQPRVSYLLMLCQPWPGESPVAVGQLLTSWCSLVAIKEENTLGGVLEELETS